MEGFQLTYELIHGISFLLAGMPLFNHTIDWLADDLVHTEPELR